VTTATARTDLATLFGQAVARHPDAIAVEDPEGRHLTYQALDELSDRLAQKLLEAGVAPGDRVGICMPKSINSVLAIVATLKTRAAYVPTDYSSPAKRNAFIFDNCETRVVLTDEPRAASLAGEGFERKTLVFPGEATDSIGAPWIGQERAKVEHPTADDLAYILYTSGSTGLPKGVMHTHASATSFVHWAAETVGPRAEDRFSSHAPFHFDLSILDLYVPMTVGAAIVLVGEEMGKEPQTLAAYIAERKISVWYSVPSILALLAQYGHLDQHDYSALHTVCFAGEVFPISHLRALKTAWPKKRYLNLYGPTETNVCTWYELPEAVEPDRTTPYPIGIICSNAEGLVLDEGRPVAEGEEGVLYIHASGPVMKGYWGMEEKTRSAFHVDVDGRRWYCTGDVVKKDADGNYLFIGRRDRMVKRRGYRIELGEIEAGLYRHPEIEEAAAVARENPEGVEVFAFICPKAGAKKPSIIALKQFCMQNLPNYMIPDRFVPLEALPRTSTDKVDYQGLLRSLPGA
jgi:amino acid adenylation domain-containing protein